jgi:uncharacterized protein YecT (DUF1311 family)
MLTRFAFGIALMSALAGGAAEPAPIAERLKAADRELNKRYQEVLATLPPPRAKELREKQREWLKFRDADVKELAGFKSDPDVQVDLARIPECNEYLLDLTVQRTAFFAAFAGEGVTPGIAGSYVDSFGGSIELKEANDGFGFDIAVMRGRLAGRLGMLEGVARWEGNGKARAVWVDPEDASCRIEFSIQPNHKVVIEGRNTRRHHGHRASFDGEYFKNPSKQ